MRQPTFLERFGHHGVCVLPGDVLSDDPLTDSETGEKLPSLREQISLTDGVHHHMVCYARVLRTCGNGLYWAEVAATPDLANTWQVILTEEDLYFTLAYDVRVQGKRPAHILKMIAAHARDVRPVQRVAPVEVSAYTPTSVLPLEPLTTIEVSTEELQAALGPVRKDTHRVNNRQNVSRTISSFRVQQGLLRVIIDTLMTQLYWTQRAYESLHTSLIKMQCALITLVQRWHRHSRQRCVNAVPIWNQERHAVIWQLTVGDPFAACVAA
jgi:hypothetical protein